MTFKLRILGRDYFEPSIAANPPILADHFANLPTVLAANFETVQDLTQYTISRLAELAGPAIEKTKPYSCLSEADHTKASKYHQHHFGCKTCCVAGQGRGNRCEMGMDLWNDYTGADNLQTKPGKTLS